MSTKIPIHSAPPPRPHPVFQRVPNPNTRVGLAIVVLLLGGCKATPEPTLAAQWGPEKAASPLTHDDCVALALASTPNSAAWRARVSSAQAALDQASHLPNPTLVVDWEDLGLDHGPTPVPIQSTYSLVTSLADLVAMPWRIDAAEFDHVAVEFEVTAEQASLAADVRATYDRLVATRRRIDLATDLLAIAERQRAAIKRFVAAGERASIDLDRAEADVASSVADQAMLVSDARAMEIEFAFALGFDRPVTLALQDSVTPCDVGSPPTDVEALMNQAIARRPEIAAAVARYHAQLERERLQEYRIQLLPTLSAGRRRAKPVNSYVASIDVQIPLFDQGDAAVDQASAELLATATEIRAVTQRIASDVATSRERWLAARSFVGDHAAPLARRRQQLRVATERLFEAGEATFEDLMATRRDEVDARFKQLEAEEAAAAAQVALDAAVGNGHH